jgi:hypothetical protein
VSFVLARNSTPPIIAVRLVREWLLDLAILVTVQTTVLKRTVSVE